MATWCHPVKAGRNDPYGGEIEDGKILAAPLR
jgi:hypothetical protein